MYIDDDGDSGIVEDYSPAVELPLTAVGDSKASVTVVSDMIHFDHSLVAMVYVDDYRGAVCVDVYGDCVLNTCACKHYIGPVLSQLRPCRIAAEYYRYPDQMYETDDFVLKGVYHGFKIVDDVTIKSYDRSNYDSILNGQFYEEMCENLRSELLSGRVTRADRDPVCIHSMGAIPKKDGSLRQITDCKRPLNYSINNFMDTTCASFSYKSVDHITNMLQPNDYLAVIDLAAAYRSVNIYPKDTVYHAFRWDLGQGPEIYFDRSLSFGLRSAPYIFTQIGDYVSRCMARRGIHRVSNYIDDFVVLGDTYGDCAYNQSILISVVRSIGFDIKWAKVTSPSQETVCLGLLIDSVNMTVSLPQAKLDSLYELIQQFDNKKSATKEELQSLAGILAHCSTVVRGGRTFSRRVINLVNTLKEQHDSTKLTAQFRADMVWWKSFAALFNGKARILRPSCPSAYIFTDSSSKGFGAYLEGDWVYGVWKLSDIIDLPMYPDHFLPPPGFDDLSTNINIQELWPVLMAVIRWGPVLRDTTLCIRSDNTQVCQMLKTGRSKNVTGMSLLRELFWLCFIYNVYINCVYIRSADNVMADYISRLAYKQVARISPTLYPLCCFRPARAVGGGCGAARIGVG